MRFKRIVRIARQQQEVNQFDPEQVRRIQEEKFRVLVRHAYEHSSFYRDLYQGIDLDNCKLTDLPVVTKQQMMDHFDDFVTDSRLKRDEIREWLRDKNNIGKYYREEFIPFHTSGTTGENALVIYNKTAMDHVHAALVTRHALPEEPTTGQKLKIFFRNLFVRRSRLAMVLMTGGPYPAYTAALYSPPISRLFTNRKFFPLLDPVDKIVRDLNEFQPDSMFCYPSMLEVLAREQLDGRLQISLDTLPTSTLTAGSEPLAESTKRLVEQAWGKKIQDTYGTSECFCMARVCKRFDRMHVMSDLCILEMVDRDNRPVPDGQKGDKVLMTNLFNFVQPFIRYEISDVTGYSTETCDCGWPFPLLMHVDGRTDDIFYIDRPGGGYEAVHPYIFLGPIVEIDEVREYQFVQTGRNEVTFNYVPAGSISGIEDIIRRTMDEGMAAANLAGRIDLKLQRVESIPRDEKSGKFRQIVSRVGPPHDLDDR